MIMSAKGGSGRREAPNLPSMDGLSQSLLDRTGMTSEEMDRVRTVQDQLGLGFIEAAMRLGLITQSDLDSVLGGEQMELNRQEAAIARPSQDLVSAHDPFDPFSEAVRALRTEIVQRKPAGESNVIAVVSAGAGEGRTRIAAELAISCSQLGQSTLLIDADFRRSHIHDLFSANNDEGLAQAIENDHDPRVQAVVGLPNLSLMVAGHRSQKPLELLSSPTFADLLNAWKRRHGHIIIDTPPASEFSDALAIATVARRVLIVARRHKTSMPQTRDMMRRIEVARASIVGGVLNEF